MKRVFVLAALVLIALSSLAIAAPSAVRAQTIYYPYSPYFPCAATTTACTSLYVPAAQGVYATYNTYNCVATYDVNTIPTVGAANGCYFVTGYPNIVFVVSGTAITAYPVVGNTQCSSVFYVTSLPTYGSTPGCYVVAGFPNVFYIVPSSTPAFLGTGYFPFFSLPILFAGSSRNFSATSTGTAMTSTCPVNQACDLITGSGTEASLGKFTETGTIVHTTTAGSAAGCTLEHGTIQMTFAAGLLTMDLNGQTCTTSTGNTQDLVFIVTGSTGIFANAGGTGRISITGTVGSGAVKGTYTTTYTGFLRNV